MNPTAIDADELEGSASGSWLDRPLSTGWCVLGWAGATAIFTFFIWLLGGPIEGDAAESVYSTWAIAHGQFACAYPPSTAFPFPAIARPLSQVAPLYPLLSGGLSALLRIAHLVPFPSQAQLGPHCSNGYAAMFKWSEKSNVIVPTIRISYASWFALMAGVIAILRASGKGRRGWEPVGLALVACVPPVFMCIVDYFHPQDLIAVGLALGAIACALRDRWVWTGILVALAVLTQQFTLLVAIPLLVIAPSKRRLNFVVAAVGAFCLVLAPLVVATSGRAIRATFIGSGNSPSYAGSILWETHLRGQVLFSAARFLPIVCSIGIAWWAQRRLGPAVLEPVPLISLIATSLGLRLVFEINIFGYYFMALAVSLVVLEVVRGKVRGYVVAWIALVTLAFNPVSWGFASNWTPWGFHLYLALPISIAAIVLVVMVVELVRGRAHPYLLLWMLLVILLFDPHLHVVDLLHPDVPRWIWQLLLVPSGLALAAMPLVSRCLGRSDEPGVTRTFGLVSVR